MEAFRLCRASPLTTATRGRGGGGDGDSGKSLVVPRTQTSLRDSNKHCSFAENLKCCNGVDGLERARSGVLNSLTQFRPQRSELRCQSNGKNHPSPVLVVVSDDEVELRRKELLDRILIDAFEAELRESDEEEENSSNIREDYEDYEDDIFRFPGAVLKWEEDLAEERVLGMKLDIRRMLTPHVRGIVLLNILTFLYGTNISIIKSAGEIMDPALFSVGRFAIASIAFAPFLTRALTKKSLRNAGVELGLLASAGYLTQCISVLTSDAARVSFISTFTVIVVPLFAGLSGEKISKITWFAAAAALFGVGLLESSGTPFAIGDVWSFVSAVMFGVHILRTEHHSTTLAPEDSLPVIALQLVVITINSGIWFCANHLNSGDLVINVLHSNWPNAWGRAVALPWLPMLYTGLLSTAFCLWTELVSMRDVKATEAAVIYTMEPLWGAAFAWLTLGERWGSNGWLGALFIIGGSLTMQLFGDQDTSAPKKVALLPSSIGFDVVDSSVDHGTEVNKSEGKGADSQKYSSSINIRRTKVLRASRIDNDN